MPKSMQITAITHTHCYSMGFSGPQTSLLLLALNQVPPFPTSLLHCTAFRVSLFESRPAWTLGIQAFPFQGMASSSITTATVNSPTPTTP